MLHTTLAGLGGTGVPPPVFMRDPLDGVKRVESPLGWRPEEEEVAGAAGWRKVCAEDEG